MNISGLQRVNQGFSITSFTVGNQDLKIQQTPGDIGAIAHHSQRNSELLIYKKSHSSSIDFQIPHLR